MNDKAYIMTVLMKHMPVSVQRHYTTVYQAMWGRGTGLTYATAMSAVMFAVKNPGVTVRIHSPASACFNLVHENIGRLPANMQSDFTINRENQTIVYKENRSDENTPRKEEPEGMALQ